MTLALVAVILMLTASLVAQQVVNVRATASAAEAHLADRRHMVACLISRTPAEYAGLVAADRPRPAPRHTPGVVDPDPAQPSQPIGL